MRPWHVAAAGAVGASSILLFFLLSDKATKYEAQAKALERAVETGEGSTRLARLARGLPDRLKNYAEAYTEPLAKRSADAHLAEHYGLTEDRIKGIERLEAALSAIGG